MATYVQIATVTVTAAGGQAAIDFTSIPSTYTDLLIKLSARSTSTSIGLVLKPNGSTSSISARHIEGAGSGNAISYTSTNIAGYMTPSTATTSTFGNTEIYIPNYAGSTNKSISSDSVTENNATAAYGLLTAWLWSNTAAITSISLTSDSGTNNFAQHSTATLYGISKS